MPTLPLAQSPTRLQPTARQPRPPRTPYPRRMRLLTLRRRQTRPQMPRSRLQMPPLPLLTLNPAWVRPLTRTPRLARPRTRRQATLTLRRPTRLPSLRPMPLSTQV